MNGKNSHCFNQRLNALCLSTHSHNQSATLFGNPLSHCRYDTEKPWPVFAKLKNRQTVLKSVSWAYSRKWECVAKKVWCYLSLTKPQKNINKEGVTKTHFLKRTSWSPHDSSRYISTDWTKLLHILHHKQNTIKHQFI